jgi:DNA-binding winged helix-turn-helix (wHTH) protein/tetratricopeptide (TPR) repeat protein
MSIQHPAEPAASSAETADYEFGPYRFEIATRSLFRAGVFVALTPKVAETLLLLLENAGRVVTKEQLLERVWPGVVVEEGSIPTNVSMLRKTLNGDFGGEGPIDTVARRGYRFTAAVARSSAAMAPAAQAWTPASSTSVPAAADRHTILVADIENRTNDPVFDGTIRQALVLHLSQSPFLDVLTDRKVHSQLAMMQRQGSDIAGEVALEICQRSGARAAITGSIFALEDDFAIGLYAVNGDTGDIIVSEQARAKGKSEVLPALDKAALALREKLGESLVSLRRFSLRFDEVATPSLDALKAYTVGRREWLEHGESAAMPHLLRAIELDPQFVSALSALALCCSNMGELTRAREYMQQAYDLRDRATERERGRVSGLYHQVVTGDIYKGLGDYRIWHQTYPLDSNALINSGNLYALLGQWDKALDFALRGMALETTAVVASNLAIAQLALGKHDDARATLENALASGYDAFSIRLDAYHEAFLRGDTDAMQRHVSTVLGRDGEEDFLIAAQADTEAYFGRFVRAREYSRRAVASARRAGALEMASMWEAEAALREAEVGNADLARAGAAGALAIKDGKQVDVIVALALARSGDIERAVSMAAALDAAFPQDTQLQRYWLPAIRAALALERRDAKAALAILEPAAAIELALSFPFEGGFMYPAYLRAEAFAALGRHAEAELEYRKIIDRPGLVKNFVLYPLAWLGTARALALDGKIAQAREARVQFVALWRDADEALSSRLIARLSGST